jgi:hypothetical protein
MWLKTMDCKTNKNITTTTGKAVWPASGVGIKTAMLIKCDGVLLKLNLPSCKRTWQCKFS